MKNSVSSVAKQQVLSVYLMVILFFGIDIAISMFIRMESLGAITKGKIALPFIYFAFTIYKYIQLKKTTTIEVFTENNRKLGIDLKIYFIASMIIIFLDNGIFYRSFKEVFVGNFASENLLYVSIFAGFGIFYYLTLIPLSKKLSNIILTNH